MKPTACVKCRQWKARCDGIEGRPEGCSRCRSLRMPCVFDPGFKRTSKAKRLQQMAAEIHELRQALQNTSSALATATTTTSSAPKTTTGPAAEPVRSPLPQSSPPPPAVNVSPTQSSQTGNETSHPTDWALQIVDPPFGAVDPLVTLSDSSHTSPAQHSEASTLFHSSIGNVCLTPGQLKEAFRRFFARFHQHLPFKMNDHPPDVLFVQCPLLFWVICAITSDWKLQSKLSSLVKSLAADVLHSASHSVETIQALLLICFWPFKVSFLSEDPSHLYSGMAIQIGLQLGLHRPTQTHSYRYKWEAEPATDSEVKMTTWMACFVIHQMQASALGLPPSIVVDSHLLKAFDNPAVAVTLSQLCRIHHLLMQANLEISSNGPNPSGLQNTYKRLELIRLYDDRLSALQVQSLQGMNDNVKIVFLSSKVQVQSFALQDDMIVSTELLNIIENLEENVYELIDLCYAINLSIAPGHVRRIMSYCGFVLARLLRSAQTTQREVLEEKIEQITVAMRASASFPDDIAHKACLLFEGLRVLQDLKRSPPILTRMSAWISYDSRRICWENWSQMYPDQDLDPKAFD